MHDLLHDPLIGVRTAQGERRVNLPELLALLSAEAIEGYTGLRAHQADPWHVFLVQLAASIQARRPTDDLPDDPAYWREGLLDLAEGIPEAWQLVVEDITKPAFLQHPWRSWEEEAPDYGVKTSRGKTVFDPKASRPDELDVLVTAKNHDVKMARVEPEEAEAWLFALLLLQTTSGFLGQGNYGIVRMNGGFASRAIVSWVSSRQWGARFREETKIVCGLRAETIRAFRYAPRGVVLTWLNPWQRSADQYYLEDLEPWFIEACRPVRLVRDEMGRMIALGATSKARQVGPKTLENGDVGDPWTPINVRDKKKGRSAFTLSAEGFTPQRLCDLLFEQGFELTSLQKSRPGHGHAWFLASCLVRGQGTTEGYHRAEIPVPPKARMALLSKQSRDSLGHLAEKQLADARAVQNALSTALALLAEGGPEKPDFERVRSALEAARRAFQRRWEADFFPTLWRGAEEKHDAVRRDWQQRLVDTAQDLLDQAQERLPLPTNRRWRALTKAQGIFHGMLRKHDFPQPRRSPAPSDVLEEETPA